MITIDPIYTLETLDELEEWLWGHDTDALRATLFAELDAYIRYEIATEWNRLVRVCESLAIVGWGERPLLEACMVKLDSFETRLRDLQRREIGRTALWTRRKAGFAIWSYFDRDTFGEDAAQVRLSEPDKLLDKTSRLHTQRNPPARMQIGFVQFTTSGNFSNHMSALLRDLQNCLEDGVDPKGLWPTVENILISCNIGFFDGGHAGLKQGPFRRQSKTAYFDLVLLEDDLPKNDMGRRSAIASYLREALLILQDKIGQNDFAMHAFRKQCEAVLVPWTAGQPTPALFSDVQADSEG